MMDVQLWGALKRAHGTGNPSHWKSMEKADPWILVRPE